MQDENDIIFPSPYEVSYYLYMPFWSRLKLLLGLGLRVTVKASPRGVLNVAAFVEGEENDLRTMCSKQLPAQQND